MPSLPGCGAFPAIKPWCCRRTGSPATASWASSFTPWTARAGSRTPSPRSFYQVNHHQAQRLYRAAIDLADITRDDTVLDLYCGVGTITLAMAKAAGKVIGVEIEPQAVADAQANARRNGIENAEFLCGDAGKAALELESRGLRPDVVVVDPPRKGLNPDAIQAIANMSPKRLVYVSCDPATLARDVALLKPHGYTLTQTEAADMFPRCAHVETVVLMSRAR